MRYVRPIWLLIPSLAIACTSITGVAPSPSAPAATPAATQTPAAVVPTITAAPVESPSDSPAASPTRKPRKTPKPTSRATPIPSKIAVDLRIYVQTADIPNPFYELTDYTIPIHIEVAGADIPDAHAEANIGPLANNFDTGPIAPTDTYSHAVTYNLPGYGPYLLELSVKLPPGYFDIDPSNNDVNITLQVQVKP